MLKLKANKVEKVKLFAEIEVDWKKFGGESRKVMSATLEMLGLEVADVLQMRSLLDTGSSTLVDVKGKNFSLKFVRTDAGIKVFVVHYVVKVDFTADCKIIGLDWGIWEQLH